jgi:HD-GYP domain-containing protein (c-di-GMP phosphodiesterase class II)
MIFVQNLDDEAGGFARSPKLSAEGFKSYCATPLIVKGQVKGVLEVFYRTALTPDPDWFDFLQSLTVQAAIAIDNASLFDELQHSNAELNLAYDTTIEGWSRALDLRDEGTEGHTERVTEMTEKLAVALGVDESELVHIRRGALLHDMGKMGIPDSILLKQDALTGPEWEIMRRHPVYAYEMLSHIIYLKRSLDIPYCHHEKWDGTGYPRGLKGEEIPLAARIFAIVDVWDATTSDRPYRTAWPKEKARTHILEQSGKYFDPHIVSVFLSLIERP